MCEMGVTLLERGAQLAQLGDAVRAACRGAGSVVLISGEAGIGKTSLVHAVRALLPPESRFLVGWCDDLATRRVLGPFRDLIGSVGATLTRTLQRGDRNEVQEALRDELGSAVLPTVLAVEDVHWADEATLDVLHYLVRRTAQLPLVLILTYRDDELEVDHPLRQLLGAAARVEWVHRLQLPPLSVEAVRRLSAAADPQSVIDPDEVFAVTSGNPYFVAQVLAAGDVRTVPLTIADAVHARVGRLTPGEREVLERLAVVPSAVEPWLLEALAPGGLPALASAEHHGLLTVAPGSVSFRHELTRRAVVDSMAASRRLAANRTVLAALLDRPGIEVSRVMHHAVGAGDNAVVVQQGPIAAREAAAAGAHREAAAHLRRVLDLEPALEPSAEADLWESLAIEGYTIDAPVDEALAAQRRAVDLRRGGDARAYGASLRWLSRICWWAADPDAANAAADEAITVLDAAGADDLLAMALSSKAQLYALAGRDAEAVAVAERAIALSREVPATLSHALNNLGIALRRAGDPRAPSVVDESLRVALAADEPEHVCRAYVNLVSYDLEVLRLDDARRHVAEAIEYAERCEFVMFSRYLQALAGAPSFATADWDAVEPAAASALDGSPPVKCFALTIVGRTRLRRGESGAIDMLREAWRVANRLRECQWIAPVAAALAEAATLRGDPDAAAGELIDAYELASRFGMAAVRAELAYWLGRAGRPVGGQGLDHPYALLADGQWRDAADLWQSAGCRYEHALALTESADDADQLTALAILDEIGAHPLARLVRSRLKGRGLAHVPRGPAPATRNNPAGLTDRQLGVLQLLAQGLTNAEIAGRLVLSTRTVDSHVAALLEKLGARNRKDAVMRARTFGIVD
jgi:DNA-binding CsgD family transcriptional regulator/tetratricopeptide (TPR) repeat protein/energy-coupling factor transporter ATP-binding protein EcfA2